MPNSRTSIVYLTAGAGGMFCGSCMHDNALARSLTQLGLDVQLVPTYTPIRTDEADISVDQVFFGGINVYLQQKLPLMRWLPGFLDRFLDKPALIRRLASRSIDMSPSELGKLAVSMLQGIRGNQRKEVLRLSKWLANTAKPDCVVFTNALIGGCIPHIKNSLKVPILVTLQGDDVFLDTLPDPYRNQCIAAISKLVPSIDGFIVHTEFFKRYMSEYFSIPIQKIHVTPLGIDTTGLANVRSKGNANAPTLGYLARIAPEKGFHVLCEAFVRLKHNNSVPGLQLRVAGWLSPQQESYLNENIGKIHDAGFESDFEYVGSIGRDEKLRFLASIDVLSVPTTYQEPKGLYVLESLACGIPVVQPNHGSFPEMISQTNGGLLFNANDSNDYCEKLVQLFNDADLRKTLGVAGQRSVVADRNSESMGRATANLIRKFTGTV